MNNGVSNGNRLNLKDGIQLILPIVATIAFSIGAWFFSSLYESVDDLKFVVTRLGVVVEIANKQMENSRLEFKIIREDIDKIKEEQAKRITLIYRIDQLRIELDAIKTIIKEHQKDNHPTVFSDKLNSLQQQLDNLSAKVDSKIEVLRQEIKKPK